MSKGNSDKKWSRDWRKGQPETTSPWNPSHAENKLWHYFWCQDVLADRSLVWLSSERLFQHLTKKDSDTHSQQLVCAWGPLWKSLGRTERSQWDCNPIERTTVSTNWTLKCSQGLNHQPKSIYRLLSGPLYICGRGLPYLASLGRGVLGPVEAWCSRAGGC